MRSWVFLFLFVLAAMQVHAQSIVIQGPQEGASVAPEEVRISFSVEGYVAIEQCRLYVDGEIAKEQTYGRRLSGSILWSPGLEEGTYLWRITCSTVDGSLLESGNRTLHVKAPEQTGVEVIPSGELRGRFIHAFTMTHSASQPPVTVPDVLAGDYVRITLHLPPSRATTEFFVRGKRLDEGKPYFELTANGNRYLVYEDANASLQVGGTEVLMTLERISGTKATFTVFSSVEPDVPPEEDVACAQVITPARNDATGECAEFPTPCDVPEGWLQVEQCLPEEPAEQPEDKPPPERPVNETPETPPAEEGPVSDSQQGVLQRILSWLAGIFGT